MNVAQAISLTAPILTELDELDRQLTGRFSDKLRVQPALTRALVSFQASKSRAAYRWFKYKEAFSPALVEYLLHEYRLALGKILDPFAGSGTALFVAAANGLDADGIELLPSGQQIITARLCMEREFTPDDFQNLQNWIVQRPWRQATDRHALSTLRITEGAYPPETVEAIEHYLGACQRENKRLQLVLRFALLCVLESISFTRKDGQYLRWDQRSGRRQGSKPFHKGPILTFDQAICAKLRQLAADVRTDGEPASLFATRPTRGQIRLFAGSCLDVLPTLADGAYEAVLTSPPYCNRYDYTRTYALELALLGLDEQGLRDLRQQMLSCTVENRAKDLLAGHPQWTDAIQVADGQELLQALLRYLDREKAESRLNNAGIPRMVRGYFYEMACVIRECARVLKPGAPLLMVNDNVRYAGASVSVDLILSDFAQRLGFCVETILVLPTGKGNSSQQMGRHGREALRKCLYVWRKR